ncbi:unnamed protein product [Adineta steineri]|uniref:Uncharacterized protein n=1 Tax=Adineta steineri TaxID=433720 RepID=A0A815QM32_9BILA|nr:unnamed protein product [Adineta steineri]CAF1492298.1 unnamed protein product [Adineta steineri]CAF4066301.1 unnamed protein product [Adineta steineri]CAF4086573.1 unnamed protein product [Adineta steineri]
MEFSSKLKAPTVVPTRTHNLLLDYIKEATDNLSKMSINRIRRATIEKAEWDTLKAFENVATGQQKIYAKTYCKSALKTYQKKKKTFDIVTAHISYDIVPKIMPHYDFQVPLDVTSLTSEQTRGNKESINKLSRDFRLKATELYLKIVKEESEFQNDKLEKLLNDFPQDKEEDEEEEEEEEVPKPPSPTLNTKVDTSGANNNGDFDVTSENEDGNDEKGVFTQKTPAPQPLLSQKHNKKSVDKKGLELFKKYIETSLKRALLETEKEVLFLVERCVPETPFGILEAQVLTPVLRKDFVLLVK